MPERRREQPAPRGIAVRTDLVRLEQMSDAELDEIEREFRRLREEGIRRRAAG